MGSMYVDPLNGSASTKQLYAIMLDVRMGYDFTPRMPKPLWKCLYIGLCVLKLALHTHTSRIHTILVMFTHKMQAKHLLNRNGSWAKAEMYITRRKWDKCERNMVSSFDFSLQHCLALLSVVVHRAHFQSDGTICIRSNNKVFVVILTTCGII